MLFLQKLPVQFSINAIVTTSDLEFNVSDIDFGHCTIYEAVTKSVLLTNNSMLPQQFGFVGLPEVDFSFMTTRVVNLFHGLNSPTNQGSKSVHLERG